MVQVANAISNLRPEERQAEHESWREDVGFHNDRRSSVGVDIGGTQNEVLADNTWTKSCRCSRWKQ